MDEARERMLEIYSTSENSNDPLSWFEELSKRQKNDSLGLDGTPPFLSRVDRRK
jgi:hypothetical protein